MTFSRLIAGAVLLMSIHPLLLQGQIRRTQTEEQCSIAAEIVRTGNSNRYAQAQIPYHDKRRWANSYIRTCGAVGAAALAEQIAASRFATDTARLRAISDPARYLLDGRIFQTAMHIAADASSSAAARTFALRTLMWALEPRLDLRYEGLIAGNGTCVYGVSFDTPTWAGSPLPGNRRRQVEQVAREIIASPSAPPALRNAAGCALQESNR